MKELNIAILSPTQVTYSETFIQAHKERLKGKIFFYSGSLKATSLEGTGNLRNDPHGIWFKILRKVFQKSYTWYFGRYLVRSFKKNKIDVVLAEYGTTADNYLTVVKELKLPLIVHFHGYDASVLKEIERCNYYKEVFDYARAIIVVSKKMYGDLLRLGCPEDRLVYNVYGPREEFLEVTPQFSKKQFISVGRFVDKKAPYYLILSFVQVIKKVPDARLIMAGSGPLINVCKNLVKYYGLEKNILFPGIISAEEFRGYLKDSIAYVQHSIKAENGNSEGTPVSILEASASGLPVISTNHAGIPDVIENSISGLLVEEHDVAAMASKMISLLNNPDLAKKLGASGKKNISVNFTLERHLHTLNELIAKIHRQNIVKGFSGG